MIPDTARLLEKSDAIVPEKLASIASLRLPINLEIGMLDHGAIAAQSSSRRERTCTSKPL